MRGGELKSDQLKQAHRARRLGRLDRALELVDRVLDSSPDDHDALRLAGELSLARNEYDTAVGYLCRLPDSQRPERITGMLGLGDHMDSLRSLSEVAKRLSERIERELKADKFLIKTAQVYSTEEAAEFLPEKEELRRYDLSGGEDLVVKGQPAWGCKVLWYSSMVNWNGAVAPCCFDKDVDFEMGQSFDGGTFGEIWQGEAYMNFRRKILADRSSEDMCRNCSEGYRGMFSTVTDLWGS